MNFQIESQLSNNESESTPEGSANDASHSGSSRRGRRFVAAFLATAMLAVGAVAITSTPASAAARTYSVSCQNGVVNTSVGISANRNIVNGGQFVSVRYFITNIYGFIYDSGYTTPLFAPSGGLKYNYQFFYMRQNFGWHDTTRVYALVAYWDGSRWSYDPTWTDIGVCLL